ncbi:Inactive leucine-rich repeat receptor-like protein kinase CORYNE [Capsicum baccatum]|uniref:Inactive leucine-rich repeat receptor-like protein kinase CORYNE n=1 Tax=Capsicum baccatum TaxID=33114 RepID=A0A2G2VNR4_CAPBA|nr:Inactive leucine-rich repeat receptor-like protein kinase CORYNE [Capsicum baccatum]
MSATALKLAFLWVQLSCVQCHGRIIKDSSTGPPQFQRIFLSILFGMFTGLICVFVFAWLVRSFVRYISKAPILKGPVVFSPKIPAKTLQSALANETQLPGSSTCGKYCRTVLDNGFTVAVKRLEPFDSSSPHLHTTKSLKRKIQLDLEVIASLRHRNLMSLRAYVRESSRFFLIYDYVPTGSLEDAMNKVREKQLQLSWEVRLRIAVGIVKALQYLHFSCNPRILHRNLKPTNVLLDAEFEPRLADCGLAKIIPTLNLPAASTYGPPESFQSCSRYTDKSDIFSFGVILGVLLTGKYPTDPFFGNTSTGGSLARWLQCLQEAGDAREALDKTILGEEVEEDEMLMAVKIAVVCLSDMPADRPSSDELVSMLTQLNSF